MRLSVIKGALVPADDDARAQLNKRAKIGDTLEVELLNERNVAFNNKVFATLDEISRMLGITTDQLRAEIMYETGYGEDLRMRDGKVIAVLPSMSKAHMTMGELETFWEEMRKYILKEVMISLDGDQQERVLQMLGAKHGDE